MMTSKGSVSLPHPFARQKTARCPRKSETSFTSAGPVCIRITDTPDFAIKDADSFDGSPAEAAVPSADFSSFPSVFYAPLSAVTSFQISAPAAKAALKTSSFVVSTEIGMLDWRRTAWITGIIRAISSSTETGV